jgi:hypothetical protein
VLGVLARHHPEHNVIGQVSLKGLCADKTTGNCILSGYQSERSERAGMALCLPAKKTRNQSELIKQNGLRKESCNTMWIVLYRSWPGLEKEKFIFNKNHCGQRNCSLSYCEDHRKSVVKKRIKRYFDLHDQFRHVTLTTGTHKSIPDKAELQEWTIKVNNFLRRLTRGRKRRGYKVLWVIECKKQASGLFHVHYHLAFLGFCPHHLSVRRIWGDVCGQEYRVHVKYRQSKTAMLNYFAYRCATAGKGMTSREYVQIVRGQRMFRVFGGLIGKGFLSLYIRSQLDQKETTEPEEKPFYYYIGTFSSDRHETRPPPALIELVKQVWQDRF